MSDRVIPKYVSDFAAKHRIDLSKVSSGSATMTCLDIVEYAKTRGDTDLQAQALTAQFQWNAAGLHETSPARRARGDGRTGSVDSMARNPLVDRVRASAAAGISNNPTAPPPTLFAAGDLPTFTASGIAPQELLSVPWEARHALAAAPTLAEAYEIKSKCTVGEPSVRASGEAIARSDYGDHPGNADYASRVQKWHDDSITDEQMEAAFAATAFGASIVEAERRAAQDAKTAR